MERKISVSDITMKLSDGQEGKRLSFRQKIELAKLLDSLGLSVIETGPIQEGKRDSLLVKSLASAIKHSTLAVPVDITRPESIEETWEAMQTAVKGRIQVEVPVSTVQMEYMCHRKPAAMLEMVKDLVSRSAKLCREVEFIAKDFGRSDNEFLMEIIKTAVEAGATMVTIYDVSGTLFDYEFYDATCWIRKALPETVKLGVYCSNEMYMADACAAQAVRAGADEIKTTPFGNETTSLKRFVQILNVKRDVCQATCDVKMTELQRAVNQIKMLCESSKKKAFATLDGTTQQGEETCLDIHDDKEAVMKIVERIGYDLDENDANRVYDAFYNQAAKNGKVEVKELDAIVASVAFQAPPTYRLESYLINSGNVISATCHIRLRKNEEMLETVCIGDGPIDAAFLAIEKIAGTKYELDDFQIQSVTEGREAMGGAIVKLRYNGRMFSGRGISTDIVEASIMAYLNAMNKIVFEG